MTTLLQARLTRRFTPATTPSRTCMAKTSPKHLLTLQNPGATGMKILTVNFLTCAVKACKTSPQSFPLHFRDAELEQQEIDFNPTFIANILPRIDWEGFKVTASEVTDTLVLPFRSARTLKGVGRRHRLICGAFLRGGGSSSGSPPYRPRNRRGRTSAMKS